MVKLCINTGQAQDVLLKYLTVLSLCLQPILPLGDKILYYYLLIWCQACDSLEQLKA